MEKNVTGTSCKKLNAYNSEKNIKPLGSHKSTLNNNTVNSTLNQSRQPHVEREIKPSNVIKTVFLPNEQVNNLGMEIEILRNQLDTDKKF